MGRPGISGVAVATTAVGGFLVWSGIRGVPIAQGLRDLTAGRTPVGSPLPAAGAQNVGSGASAAGSVPTQTGGSAIASAASKYLGVPYRWGFPRRRDQDPREGLDCSGLVTVVLRDLGYQLPSMTHTTSAQFMVWRGAYTVKGPAQSGDLLCWLGHIGIATGPDTMIAAPTAGDVVKVQKIWRANPVIRRVGSYSGATRAR